MGGLRPSGCGLAERVFCARGSSPDPKADCALWWSRTAKSSEHGQEMLACEHHAWDDQSNHGEVWH